MDELIKQESLRILMTTDTVGGVWSYTMELCRAMQVHGVQICLVTTGASLQPAQKKEAAALHNTTVHETHFLLEWMDQPWDSIDASGGWLLQLEAEWQPHLIHLNGFVYGALPWKAPVIVVAHSDVFSWWQAVLGESPSPDWNEYYRRVRNGLQGADYLIAPSHWMMEQVRHIYKTTTPGGVIYNGRSAGFYAAEKEPFVFSMGRIWDKAKNIQLLVQAAPQLCCPVKLAGDQQFGGNNCATEQQNIHYLGRLGTAGVAEQLSKAALYVLPAKYEPFGLSILEAALSGCALVLGNIASLKEIWEDSAVYVDTDDAAALANTINGLMADEAARFRYAQKARNRAALYATEGMGDAYRQVYEGLLQLEKQTLQTESA